MVWFYLAVTLFIGGIILKKLFELFEGWSLDKSFQSSFETWVSRVKLHGVRKRERFTYLDWRKYAKLKKVKEEDLRHWLTGADRVTLKYYAKFPLSNMNGHAASTLIGAVDNADRLKEYYERQLARTEEARRARYAQNAGGLSVHSDASVGGLSEAGD